MTIITFSSHDKYSALLRPFLASVFNTMKNIKVKVIYYDYRIDRLAGIKKTFPNVEFINMDLGEEYNFFKVNSGRIRHFRKILDCIPENESVAFMDCDTFILKDFQHLFKNKFDVALTYKKDDFPINFGVILGNNSKRLKNFFEYTAQRIDEIFSNDEYLMEATLKSGAADQHSANELIFQGNKIPFHYNFNVSSRKAIYSQEYNIDINDESTKIIFFECEKYNQVLCAPLDDNLHIIHFKSSWHPILNGYIDFKDEARRNKEQCTEMFNAWQNMSKIISEKFTKNMLLALNEDIDKKVRKVILSEQYMLNKKNFLSIISEYNKKSDLKIIHIKSLDDNYINQIEKVFISSKEIFVIHLNLELINKNDIKNLYLKFKFVYINGDSILIFPDDKYLDTLLPKEKNINYYILKIYNNLKSRYLIYKIKRKDKTL